MLLSPARSEEVKARIQSDVEGALTRMDVSARRASLDVVGNDGLVRDIRAGRLPGIDRLEALYEYLGLEFYYGPRRTAPALHTFAEPGGMTDLTGREGLRAGYLPLPWHEAMPAGTSPSAPVAFARTWLEERGLDPAALAAVRTEGGDIAVIEPQAPRRGGPVTWACREGAAIFVARVQFEGPITLILPEDSDAPIRVQTADAVARIGFLGRVVWLGRTLPD